MTNKQPDSGAINVKNLSSVDALYIFKNFNFLVDRVEKAMPDL
jgi:hypothetical protein